MLFRSPEHRIPEAASERVRMLSSGSDETSFPPPCAQGADLKAIGWGTETKLHLPPYQLLPQNRKIILPNTIPSPTPQLDEEK